MRHWILILMIALLPLRGWVGDAMAVEMSGAPVHSATASAASAADPCPGHAAGAGNGAVSASADHAHSACDVCNGPALALVAFDLQGLPFAHSVMVRPSERFASTEARRGIKPPIS